MQRRGRPPKGYEPKYLEKLERKLVRFMDYVSGYSPSLFEASRRLRCRPDTLEKVTKRLSTTLVSGAWCYGIAKSKSGKHIIRIHVPEIEPTIDKEEEPIQGREEPDINTARVTEISLIKSLAKEAHRMILEQKPEAARWLLERLCKELDRY